MIFDTYLDALDNIFSGNGFDKRYTCEIMQDHL